MRRLIVITCLLIVSFKVVGDELSYPQEILVTTKDSQSYKLHIFEPSASNRSGSAMITLHGGGWKWGKAEWTFNSARKFAEQHGMLAVALDYRLSNDEITPVDAFRDTCDALKWVRDHAEKFKINANKVATYGVSAGGHLSSLAATIGCDNDLGSKKNGGPDLLLLWSPALDMENDGWFEKLLLGKSKAKDHSPLSTVNKNMPPVSIVQGELDTLTPLSGAKTFCQKIQSEKGICELNVYPGVGHLLTRNLKNQEDDFDPEPRFVKDGNEKFIKFLKSNGFINPKANKAMQRSGR